MKKTEHQQNDSTNAQVEKLIQENNALRQDYNELKLKFIKSHRKQDNSDGSLDDNELYKQLQQSNEDYLDLYIEKQNQNRETIQIYQAQVAKLQSLLETKNKDIIELNEKLNELRTKNALLKSGVEEARNDILHLEKMNDDMVQPLQDYAQKLKGENEQLRQHIATLEAQYNSKI